VREDRRKLLYQKLRLKKKEASPDHIKLFTAEASDNGIILYFAHKPSTVIAA